MRWRRSLSKVYEVYTEMKQEVRGLGTESDEDDDDEEEEGTEAPTTAENGTRHTTFTQSSTRNTTNTTLWLKQIPKSGSAHQMCLANFLLFCWPV